MDVSLLDLWLFEVARFEVCAAYHFCIAVNLRIN